MYKKGEGVEQDLEKAIYWFELAANQNVYDAAFELGYLYYYDRGKFFSYLKAKDWFLKAAKNGNAVAQYRLGIIFYSGYGTPVNNAKAIYWLKKSADQGNNPALNLLRNITPVEPTPPTPTPEIVTEPSPPTPTTEQTKKNPLLQFKL